MRLIIQVHLADGLDLYALVEVHGMPCLVHCLGRLNLC